MVDDGKNQNQRKRRQERESCINNVKLNHSNSSRRNTVVRPIDNSTYTRRPRDKLQRGSLENVSSNPWGDVHLEAQSSLRRSRSLAITREDIFTNLDIQIAGKQQHRRAQLIPRAKLIERSGTRERCANKGSSVENLQITAQPKRKSSLTPPDYSPPQDNHSRNRPQLRQPRSESPYHNLVAPKFIIGNELDSLDSNYNNKTSINTAFRVSYEDLPGLSLPNYYPDSKYDTDNTDNISFTDEISTESCDNSNKKYSSCDNISTGQCWAINEAESISYDENIVLSANRPLYDSIRENHYAKPRTIRGPTPYNKVFYKEKRRSYSSDSSEDKRATKDEDKISLDYFETDSNFDEIKLNNENITKIVEIDEEDKAQQNSLISIVPVESVPAVHPAETVDTNNTTDKKTDEIIEPVEDHPEYKTIVTIDPDTKNDSEEEKNKHSHNYLREFLETQKGSRKPLQNFITKKLSNLSRKNSKDVTSNLADNRFYSLPDITASKNLSKCEKIDRKLRKCEKTTTVNKLKENNESRFIVNIGKHFDITANSNIPVDFEVKIAKVPKKHKSKKTKDKADDQFIEAVKTLKETLNHNVDENQNIANKPEIIAVKPKTVPEFNSEQKEREEQEITMNLQEEQNECTREYHERLGTMRNYWDKMVNGHSSDEDKSDKQEAPPKCKIVEEVKKKFEPGNEPEPEKPSKIQIVKQIFERKPVEKTEKLSPFIKETCNYFENSNQFESLNPNIVEIIHKGEEKEKEIKEKSSTKHKGISKSRSIIYPEFDHVRYRVVKSDLFQKKIFANCEKESQFDGLMQYLQDYSFQELLRDNNIVIIEPIRTKIPHETSKTAKAAKNITPFLHKNDKSDDLDSNGLKRHFFYHPIRVNKEVNDDELPNPDTVKQVRQFFEGGLKRSQSTQEFEGIATIQTPPKSIDPDKDHCSATDTNSSPSNISDFGSQENLYDSITEHCCEQQYVSEDIMKKIRDCGTTVTYYGGRVVKKHTGQPSLTKVIMEEIKNNERRSIECNCQLLKDDGDNKDTYQGVKFKLIKSNSCNSRLELVGTSDLKEAKQKYLKNKHRQQTRQNNLKNVKEDKEVETAVVEKKYMDKNSINENIKKTLEDTQPKIIGEERKMTQWGDITKEKTFNGINFNEKSRQKVTYDYHNYDNVKNKSKKIDEMEFESYEVA